MPIDVLMPKLSPTMTEGRFSKWTVKVGDALKMGQIIAEVETDKAVMEVEAPEDGIVHALMAEAGADIPLGMPIAVLKNKDEDVAPDYKPTPKLATPAPAAAPAAKAAVPSQRGASAMPSFNMALLPVGILPPVTDDHGNRHNASPVARRLAAGWGIPLQAIHGSGPLGRIIKRDVEAAYMLRQSMGGAGASTPLPAHIVQLPVPELAGEYDLLKHTPMRKSIAQRLTYSKQAVPHFYLDAEIDMDATLARRKQLNDTGSVKLTVNDFIIAACAKALADFPAANASWTDDGMAQYKSVDISVAVAIDGGLITPIVKGADKKALATLSTEIKQLAEDARAGKLKPVQYQGGNFSISNLGMYGITHFQAIINPPQSAILAVGKAEPRVVADAEGKVKVANRMSVSLSVDHRVIDGALGAELLMRIKQYLEQPEKLAL